VGRANLLYCSGFAGQVLHLSATNVLVVGAVSESYAHDGADGAIELVLGALIDLVAQGTGDDRIRKGGR
jgi:hypothetical protein